MNADRRYAVLAALLLFLPGVAVAQGFAGLGSDAEGFSVPQSDPVFDFPADHGAHYDYRIEWWYLTATLEAADGTPYGLQWTLFRNALAPEEGEGWSAPQVWMGHAAVTTPEAHYIAERFARGGIGQAGVIADPFSAWIDDWEMAGPDFGALRLRATGADFAFDMDMTAQGPLVFHGAEGFSVKSQEGQASYYYSQPFYDVSGILHLPEGEVEVTGHGWLDREWSSQPLSEDQVGWDWFSLTFDTGERMMGFLLRQTDGTAYSQATWIDPDGTSVSFPDGAFDATPLATAMVAGREIPVRWQVRLPDRALDVTVEALNADAWMDLSVQYWEGPVAISGTHSGRGYLEMTGYE